MCGENVTEETGTTSNEIEMHVKGGGGGGEMGSTQKETVVERRERVKIEGSFKKKCTCNLCNCGKRLL